MIHPTCPTQFLCCLKDGYHSLTADLKLAPRNILFEEIHSTKGVLGSTKHISLEYNVIDH